MSVVLSERLPLLATAPGGIQKLRGLILELAVRGKLVPQDPKDEPASELLNRIAQERARLEAEGKIKKAKQLPPLGEDEPPFELPNTWEWSRLGIVSEKLTDGSHNPPPDFGSGLPMFSSQNVQDGWIDTRNPSRYLSAQDFESEDSRTKVSTGDVLLTIVASIGRSAVVTKEHCRFALQRSVAVIRSGLAPEFLSIQLRAPVARSYYDKHGKGTAQKGIYLGKLGEMPVAIPPLAEQHRIVAKVHELMVLCDRLEAEQADAGAAHARLVDTLLGTLTLSTDATELATNWQRLAEHFDTLFTTESSLDALKQTILQLAVMGKLVPQDPDDEPASELLKQIAKERARLESEGVCKKSQPMQPLGEDELPFLAPEGWEWTRWGNVTHWMTYGFTRPMPHVTSGPTILTAKNVFDGSINFQNVHFTTGEAFAALSAKDLPAPGDILITKDGSIGRAAVVPVGAPMFCINQSVAVLWLRDIPVDKHFLVNTIHSDLLQRRIWEAAEGAAIKHISITDFVKFPLPLPPLAEQHRIVAKVDELMALCDRLKAGLAESRTQQERLATTLIESALKAA